VDESAVAVLWAVFEVDLIETEIVDPAFVFEVVFAVVVAVVDVEVLNPRPPVTPTLSVGRVTERSFGAVEICTAEVVFALVVVVDFANVGHKAPWIPPLCMIPNNELLVTCVPSQALMTSFAIELRPATQAGVHPVWKSVTTQLGICPSYVSWQTIGIEANEML
jgi:hypothetical protein